MDSSSIICELGIHAPELVAGFAGGMVNAFIFKKSTPFSVIGSIFAGGVTANYLSPSIGWFLGTTGLTTAFIVGLGGMGICQKIIESAGSLSPFNKGTKNG